jgi:hypothetical protein
MIRQQRGQGIQAFLPEPLDRWSVGDTSANTSGASIFGGGTAIEREYSNGSSTVTIRILTDSPMMQTFMMMFSNPMMLTAQGGSLQMINGQQAVVKPDGIMMVVQNTYLIQLEGSASIEDMTAYAEGIDLDGLKAYN